MKIEALHEFHDAAFSKAWADKFTPTSARIELFETILQRIKRLKETRFHIVELGIGPGFLAEYLLTKLENITYEGLDYSNAMLDLAADRLHKFKDRTTFTQADLTNPDWIEQVKSPKVIVSTWALHDLFSEENIHSVYLNTAKVLGNKGLFLNGDFIKPDGVNMDYEKGRIEIATHLKLLKAAGFQSVQCLKEFEIDVVNPTTSNNYACFEARNL